MIQTLTLDTGKNPRRRGQEEAVALSQEKEDQDPGTEDHAHAPGDQGPDQETGGPGLETEGLEIEDLTPEKSLTPGTQETKDQRNIIEDVHAPKVETAMCREKEEAKIDPEAKTAAPGSLILLLQPPLM